MEDEMRRQKSNRDTTQAMHKIWNYIDERVHICDAYVYFEHARLSPLGAQQDLIYRVQAFVTSSVVAREITFVVHPTTERETVSEVSVLEETLPAVRQQAEGTSLEIVWVKKKKQ